MQSKLPLPPKRSMRHLLADGKLINIEANLNERTCFLQNVQRSRNNTSMDN